ncbi:MAG TPA: CBS domain-containing protein [Kiritimatiellia bacterium]|jgi:IMP dehydrogenase|nr:CBS domain-containing protein [Kiritimatiellia bacterium]OQC56121.1 MAG: Hypoxic response protein 1 [Verrucomicrobia bacterium ADurb.Bin018]MBP9572775.1 CBS domain-containing protein [Kiritimatiellia bacterium]HOD99471.1 CBS domain-containing protein [Kiritimatiellia bacterium]HOE36042.1 CBS domain-containing protein [Kiritimatiellia bacterium]
MSTTVGDLLRRKGSQVETITAQESILVAIRRMSEKHIGCLAVVTKTGKLSGIISERDCLWKVIAAGKSPKTRLVKEVMTSVAKMHTVTPQQTAEECMGLMTSGRHRHLPVLADGKLAGLISIGDIVKEMLDSQQATIASLEKYITGTF